MLTKEWYIDFQFSKNVPDNVLEDVREIWSNFEKGNDETFITDLRDLRQGDYLALANYLEEQGLPEDETVIVSYGW